MKSTVSSENLLINNKEYTLVGISSSPSSFGICNTTRQKEKGQKETFFIGHEALINIIQRSVNDQYSNKILWQISSMERCGDFPRRSAAACKDYFNNGKTVMTALQPIFDYLKNGLYIIYEADMIPTDGAGNFFWTSYLISHELSGSGTYSQVCRKERPLPPAFLVPTESIANYSDNLMHIAEEKVKKDDCAYGLCFHLSGMFCALLSNHHEATAAIIHNKKIHCLVIEPIRNIYSASEASAYSENNSADNTVDNENCIYTCCAKIPFSSIPQSLLEAFFVTRRNEVGKYSESVQLNSEKTPHLKGKRVIPDEITEKCEKMPNAEMLQSAAMVDYLTDDQIDALLRGETMLNERYIINKNYYSSVTIAFNYLQYKDFNKFIDFAVSILQNEDLTAVHQYVAQRLQPIMNEAINNVFKEITQKESSTYVPIQPLAEKYVKRYKQYIDTSSNSKEKASASVNNNNVLKRNMETELNSLEMAKKLHSVGMKK